MTCSSAWTRSGRQAGTTSERRARTPAPPSRSPTAACRVISPDARRAAADSARTPATVGRSTSTASASRSPRARSIARLLARAQVEGAHLVASASPWSSWPVIRLAHASRPGRAGRAGGRAAAGASRRHALLHGPPARRHRTIARNGLPAALAVAVLVLRVAQPAGVEGTARAPRADSSSGARRRSWSGATDPRVMPHRSRSSCEPRRADRGSRRRRPLRRRPRRRSPSAEAPRPPPPPSRARRSTRGRPQARSTSSGHCALPRAPAASRRARRNAPPASCDKPVGERPASSVGQGDHAPARAAPARPPAPPSRGSSAPANGSDRRRHLGEAPRRSPQEQFRRRPPVSTVSTMHRAAGHPPVGEQPRHAHAGSRAPQRPGWSSMPPPSSSPGATFATPHGSAPAGAKQCRTVGPRGPRQLVATTACAVSRASPRQAAPPTPRAARPRGPRHDPDGRQRVGQQRGSRTGVRAL